MYGPLPIPVLILCVILFVAYLRKHKKPRRAASPCHVVKNDYTRANAIEKSMVGYSCEKTEISVLNSEKAAFTMRYPLGTEVAFVINDGMLHLVIGGKRICNVYFGQNSNVLKVVENGMAYRAFITDRDERASGFMDFFTVSVFYRQ